MDLNLPRVSRRAALGLLGAAAGGLALGPGRPAFAADPTAGGQPDVEIIDNGATVTLRNGIVSATFNKATTSTTSLYLIGSTQGNEKFNVVGGNRGSGYPTLNISTPTKNWNGTGINGGTYSLVSRSADRVEIAITVNNPTNLPCVLETHVALERGASGLYYWQVYRYTSDMPDGFTIGQLRYAFALGDKSFTYFVVDDKRGVQQRPAIADTAKWTTMQDTTYILPDGRLWSKYQNITDLEGDNHVFMASNGKVGVALIQASKEYFDGGPTKQELTVHDYYDGEILLWHPHTGHYGSPAVVPAKGWEKIFGPFFLHVNESAAPGGPGAAVADLWSSAKKQAEQERAKWPYAWISDPLYAADTRAGVTGQFTVEGLRSLAGGWVILSKPGEDWQTENQNYWYSGRTDADGRFTVKGVRPGEYTMTAFFSGALGEYTSEKTVVVAARTDLDLGTLQFTPANHGRTIWQIGTPDRSSAEFYIPGGPDGFRKQMAWLEYPYEFPNDVDFKVGVDDPARKWNYFHPAYRTPGTDLQLKWRGTKPDRSLCTWKIRFDSHEYTEGTATLDIAVAGAVFGTLKVALNGVDLASVDPLPAVAGDNSSYRLTYLGIYRQLAPITFPAGAITAGENVITLSPTRAPKAPTSDNWMEPMAGIMYDTIRLQIAVDLPPDGATQAPAQGVLSTTSGWKNGLRDGTYDVNMNLWHGMNASLFVLYENGKEIARQTLSPKATQAQSAAVAISGRPNGTYVYSGELRNQAGVTVTTSTTVKVTDATPGKPVLSSDNWDHDGSYTMTTDMWWGTNATEYRLYENDILIDSQALTAASPAAQHAKTKIEGRTPGSYTYVAELVNLAGVTRSEPYVVTPTS